MTKPIAALDPLKVDMSPEYVRGYPIPVALTVNYRVEGRDTPGHSFEQYLIEVPIIELLSVSPNVGATLTDAVTGAAVFGIEPETYAGEHEWQDQIRLFPNQPRRVLIDASLLFPPDLAAGRYRVSFAYDASGRRSSSRDTVFVLREPTREELTQFPPAHGRWDEWMQSPPESDTPVSADDPAQLHRIVRSLIFAPSLAQADPQVLTKLDGFYKPEARAIELELLTARGRGASSAGRLRADHPELSWWIDAAAKGASPITQWNRFLRT
jgi:hypothetical protein